MNERIPPSESELDEQLRGQGLTGCEPSPDLHARLMAEIRRLPPPRHRREIPYAWLAVAAMVAFTFAWIAPRPPAGFPTMEGTELVARQNPLLWSATLTAQAGETYEREWGLLRQDFDRVLHTSQNWIPGWAHTIDAN